MKIETLFNVGDLAQHRYHSHQENYYVILSVMEVQTQTCYAGTQTFYLCRSIMLSRKEEKPRNQDQERPWTVGYSFHEQDNSTGWKKYREDELLPAEKSILKILDQIKS